MFDGMNANLDSSFSNKSIGSAVKWSIFSVRFNLLEGSIGVFIISYRARLQLRGFHCILRWKRSGMRGG